MIYSAMAFTLISAALLCFPMTFAKSVVMDGVCYPYAVWKSRASRIAFSIWYFLSFYVVVLIIFIVCYWRILVAIRRPASECHSRAYYSLAQLFPVHQIG